MLHVYLLTLERSPHIKKSSDLNSAQRNLLINFLKACYQYDFTKPLDCLKLSQNDYTRACEYVQLIEDHKDNFIHLGSEGTENEIEKKLGFGIAEIKNSLKISSLSRTSSQIDLSRLDDQKDNLERSLSLSSSQSYESDYQDVITPLFGNIRTCLQQASLPSSSTESDKIIHDLQLESDKVIHDLNLSFEDQIKTDLIKDILKAKYQQNFTSHVIDPVHYPSLKENLDADVHKLIQSANDYRSKILKIMRPHKKSAWHSFEHDLANSWESHDSSFRELLYAAATHELSGNNFNTYYKVELAKNTDLDELKANIRFYLEAITTLQQHQKARHLLEQCLHTKSPSLNRALADLLTVERQYDCQKDPHAIAILLLEAEQKIITRKSQLEHFRTMISKPNLFKHAALADGKTTFLRNLISKSKANRQNLSCVITHEPLIAIHHKQLERATSEAYGDKVYRFEFNRDHATDALSLRIIRNNLLTCITQNGRLDFTPHDLLSLHHSYILKFEDLVDPTSKRNPDVINEEIDVLSEILAIFKTKAVVSSDEIDKMVEANKQHNYGLGKPSKLDENKCLAGSSLVEWILSDKIYGPLFQNSDIELWKFANNKEFKRVFLKKMASKAISTYLPELNSDEIKTAIRYLTDRQNQSSSTVKKFRKTKINSLPTEKQLVIKTFHKLFHKIIPDSFKKRSGLNYIRSEDGIQVKPVIRNGKCSELSEFGTEEETIWFSCLSYMNSQNKKTPGGVTPNQIAQLVLDLKNESAKDVAKKIKENPHEYVMFNQTASAKKFKANFKIDLDAVNADHYPLLAKRINNNPSLLANFLQQYVFPVSEYHSYQIVGNPQHLVAMFKEFFGSSGTSNICRSLPDQININPAHVKQPGADGSVFLHLLQTFSLSDLLQYDDQANIPSQIGSLLKNNPGSALIDCAPVFPGLTADKIIENIAPFMPKKSLIRYTNDEDQEVVFDNEYLTISPENSAAIDNAFTILDKAQTRGTNKDMPYDSYGLLTINKLTTLTDFLQSAMRMRKFGKGQKIKLVVDAHTYSSLVKGGITKSNLIKNLINLLCHNESEFLKYQHHSKSEIQKLQSRAENVIYYALLQIKNPTHRKQIWTLCRHFFIKPSQETLETLDVAERQKFLDDLKRLVQNEIDKLQDLIKNIKPLHFEGRINFLAILQTCLDDLESNKTGDNLIDPKYLPLYSYSSSVDLHMNNSVQKEQNIKSDREVEQEIDLDKKAENLPKQIFVYCWRDIWDKEETPSLTNLLTKLTTPSDTSPLIPFAKHVEFYDKGIYFTHNLYRPADKSVKTLFPDLLPWADGADAELPPGQTRLFKMALVVDRRTPNKVYGILGSLKDFDHVFCKLQDPQYKENGIDYYIYSLTTDSLVGGNWPADYSQELQKNITRVIVQAKHLAGEVHLQEASQTPNSLEPSQCDIFKNWLVEKFEKDGLNIVNLEKNLRRYLRDFRPTMAKNYSGSPMAKIYTSCKKLCKKLVKSKSS